MGKMDRKLQPHGQVYCGGVAWPPLQEHLILGAIVLPVPIPLLYFTVACTAGFPCPEFFDFVLARGSRSTTQMRLSAIYSNESASLRKPSNY
jgi:hypothetical protein